MDIFVVILIAIIITEIIISCLWVPFYFLKGITLFKKSISFEETINLPFDDLMMQFNREVVTPIVFHPIGENIIAFREKWVSFTFINYTPVMHGLIRVDPEFHEITVTGYANWFFLLFFISLPALFFYYSPEKPGYGFAILFVLISLAALYGIQYIRFTKIEKGIKSAVETQKVKKSQGQT